MEMPAGSPKKEHDDTILLRQGKSIDFSPIKKTEAKFVLHGTK